MRQSRAEQAREFAQRRGFAQKVEYGHCSGGLSLRLRAFALALRGPPAISQIAVLSAVLDRRYNAPVGYVENNLITGEAVTYRARLHWILFVKPTLIALVIIAIGGLVFYAAESRGGLSTEAALGLWLAVLIVAAVPVLAAVINWRSAEFAVTNKRVILKTGFIQSKTEEMFLNKIESVGVDQSISGRILGFGTIVIRGTGGSLEPFHRVSSPLRFRNEIQEQIGKSFEPGNGPH